MTLDGYDDGGDSLSVIAHARGDDLAFELRGKGGTLHYAATLHLGPGAPPEAPAASDDLRLEPSPWSVPDLYSRGVLFHGPALHAVRDIEGISAHGLIGSVQGMHALGWPAGSWSLDVAALDGALQLARVYGAHRSGRPSLPTRIGSIHLHGDGPLQGPLRCVLMGRLVGDHRTESRVQLADADGRAVATLDGVEMHLLAESLPLH